MNKRIKQALILFLILVFPSLFYVILSGSNHDIVGLPYYGPKEVDEKGDTAYYEVTGLNAARLFTNGEPVKKYLAKSVKIVSFIDFTAESYRVMEQMQSLHERFGDKPDVILITAALEQPSDSLFNALTETYSITRNKWFLVNAEAGLHEDLQIQAQTAVNAPFSNVITIVDQDNRLRGYFDGIQYVDTKEVREAVKALRFKNYRPVKTKNRDEGE